MSAHTPGPWEFIDNALVGPKIDNKPIWLRPVILRPEVGVNPIDARLIAAAPDLLAALQCVLSRFDAVYDIGDVEMQPALYMARAAIARATGAAE